MSLVVSLKRNQPRKRQRSASPCGPANIVSTRINPLRREATIKMDGIVNWYDEQQGRGFITGRDGNDVFVYKSSLDFLTILHSGDRIEYEVVMTASGPQAKQIKVL
jgi:cold shock CspA family protein